MAENVVVAPEYVLLKCVKEGSKLRVKMMSTAPFVKGANCQFPRAVRVDGTYFVVRAEKVKLCNRGGSSFYAAMQSGTIVCQTQDEAEVRRYIEGIEGAVVMTIFGDDDDIECVVCMSAPKDSVYSPCGHFVCCAVCASKCALCPMCRANVVSVIKRALIE